LVVTGSHGVVSILIGRRFGIVVLPHLTDTAFQHFLVENGLLADCGPRFLGFLLFVRTGRRFAFLRHAVKPPFRGCSDTHRNSVPDTALYGATEIWSGQYFAPPFQVAVCRSYMVMRKQGSNKGNHQEHSLDIANGSMGEKIGGDTDYHYCSES